MAQEFESPATHQAGDSGSSSTPSFSGSVAYRNPNNPTGRQAISVGVAPYYSSINNDYVFSYGSRGGNARSYYDFLDNSYGYNRQYLDYNNSMFQSAMEYDRYMSNTAIQRQVADLKAAGLNPVLATRLGGAIYHGVQAPYVAINPAGSLQALSGYESSRYATDVGSMTTLQQTALENSSRELITQYNMTMQRLINGDTLDANKDMIELKKVADRYLDEMKFLDDKELKRFGFENQKVLKYYQNELNVKFAQAEFDLRKREFNWKNLGYDSIVPPNSVAIAVNGVSRMIPGSSGIFY